MFWGLLVHENEEEIIEEREKKTRRLNKRSMTNEDVDKEIKIEKELLKEEIKGLFGLRNEFERVDLNWFGMKVWTKKKMIKFEWKFCELCHMCNEYFDIF